MLWWLPRRRARIIDVDAEAKSLIGELGLDAYDEARRREIEASSDAIGRDWHRVGLAIARQTRAGLGTSIQTPPQTAVPPGPASPGTKEVQTNLERSPLDRLNSAISASSRQFRVQFVRAAHGASPPC